LENGEYHCSFDCPNGSSRDQGGNCVNTANYLNPVYAYPSNPFKKTGDVVIFGTTCCKEGGNCYNQMAYFLRNFVPGQDPKTRKLTSLPTNMCGDHHAGACPWSQKFQTGFYSNDETATFGLDKSFFDRNHLTPGTALGRLIYDSQGSAIFCQASDLSVLYYDNGSPCVANMACEAIAFGGKVTARYKFETDCQVRGQVINYHAIMQIYEPNGNVFCEDYTKIGYSPGRWYSSKCDSEVEMSGYMGDIKFNKVHYPDGYVQYDQKNPGTKKTYRSCNNNEAYAEYSQGQ
jgi:hypothetical protein